MNKQDLRVIKTRNIIKNTFYQMLKKENGSIKNVSVTALTKQAQISKGAFYSHYQDIYALYNEVRDEFLQQIIDSIDYFPLLLTKPEEFLNDFIKTINLNMKKIALLWPDEQDFVTLCSTIDDYAEQKVYEICSLKKTVANDIILQLIFSSLIRLAFINNEKLSKSNIEKEPEGTIDILLKIISIFLIDPDEN